MANRQNVIECPYNHNIRGSQWAGQNPSSFLLATKTGIVQIINNASDIALSKQPGSTYIK